MHNPLCTDTSIYRYIMHIHECWHPLGCQHIRYSYKFEKIILFKYFPGPHHLISRTFEDKNHHDLPRPWNIRKKFQDSSILSTVICNLHWNRTDVGDVPAAAVSRCRCRSRRERGWVHHQDDADAATGLACQCQRPPDHYQQRQLRPTDPGSADLFPPQSV